MAALRLVVLVSGRGSNLQALLDAQKTGSLESRVVKVVSNKAQAPALERAANAGVPTAVIPSVGKSSNDFFTELRACVDAANPDLVVLAGFMKILPADFVDAFAGRIVNIHPSLLPRFPGLNAQKQALDAGVKTTGCTVHFVDHGCDTGPVILQKIIDVLPGDTEESLSSRLLSVEHAALVEAIRRIETGKCAAPSVETR
jgi:phosphoribosylglycinamide formyltransferase-1